jgi:ATP:corrinoid adenosyltransferase
MNKQRKTQLALTDAINEWMKEEDMNVGQVANMLDTTPNRAAAAILGREWDPSLKEVARVEAAVEEEVLAVSGKTN